MNNLPSIKLVFIFTIHISHFVENGDKFLFTKFSIIGLIKKPSLRRFSYTKI